MILLNKGRMLVEFDRDTDNYINRTDIGNDSNVNVDGFYNAEQLRLAIHFLVEDLKKKFDAVPIWDKLLCFYPMMGGGFNIIKHNLVSNSYELLEIYNNPTMGDLKPYGTCGKIYRSDLIFDFPDNFCAGYFNTKFTDVLGAMCAISAKNNSNNLSHNPNERINPNWLGFNISTRAEAGYIISGNGGLSNYYNYNRPYEKGALIISGKSYPATTQFVTTNQGILGSNITVTSSNNIYITFGGRTEQHNTQFDFIPYFHYANCFFIGNQLLTLQERTHMANAIYNFNSRLSTNPYTNTF
ncbi:hypothetical protein [Pedobacter sp. UBA4863]|uniref:hypothetical protein n=1 Tax=Pedobacter sp. UBA4863 TaxID=1947060 RepID=UPI0025EBA960|nr:hypothetical protein [Pedobacter sp. UBA4863]